MKRNMAGLRRILAAAVCCALLAGSGTAAVGAAEESAVPETWDFTEEEAAAQETESIAENPEQAEAGAAEENPEEGPAVTDASTVETEEAAEATEAEEELIQAPAGELPSVRYRTHVQTYGWEDIWKENGAMSGTSGQSKRLEGIEIQVSGDADLGIRYRTHIQTYGWESAWKENGVMSGTSGQSKRLEAIQIELTGSNAAKYDVWYCVHAQQFGWLNWAKNGAEAGTAGYSYRLEGIEIRILPKGSIAPANEGKHTAAFYSKTEGPALQQGGSGIAYNTHVQTYGWQDWKTNGAMSGTSGQSKRLEGLHIVLTDQTCSGDVEYRTHVQTYGWQVWKKNGQMAGTSGESKRLEAVQIRLTGEMAARYDIWYRVHAQKFGWMGWAKNGAMAGTAGYSYRLEALQIVLTEKGASAPASDLGGCRQTTAEAYSENKEKTFPTLQSLGIPYGSTVNSKVDKELRKLYELGAQQGIDIDALSDYDKAYVITQYIGSYFSYAEGSHTAESMLDTGSGTCYAYADLTLCFARKLGLVNTWVTVPGRHVNHDNRTYGALHRSAISLIDGKYYDLDSNIYYMMAGVYDQLVASGFEVDPDVLLPEQISKAYADYLIGNTNTRPAAIP